MYIVNSSHMREAFSKKAGFYWFKNLHPHLTLRHVDH